MRTRHHKLITPTEKVPMTRSDLERRYFLGFSVCTALGMLLLYLCRSQLSVETVSAYGASLVADRTAQPDYFLFGSCFLTSFAQLTALMLCSLCCFGFVLVPLSFVLLGASFLLQIYALFQVYQWNGLICYWVLFWLPSILNLLTLTVYAAKSFHVTVELGQNLIGMQQSEPHPDQKKTVFQFIICIFPAAILSGLSVLLVHLFAGRLVFL